MPAIAATAAVAFACDLFDGLSHHERETILSDATIRSFPAGAVITEQEARASHLFILRSGCARLIYNTPEGGPIPLIWVKPGEVLGGMSVLLNQRNYLVSSKAYRDCEFYCWGRERFRRHLERNPHMMNNAVAIASGYVEWLIKAHARVAAFPARARLAEVLLGYVDALGVRASGGLLIDVTNEELAHDAHITRYTTCRLLVEWQKARVLSKARGKLLVRDLEALRNFSLNK